ncbi:archaellin/type IV pilin N-terminal domain-containing protein [Saccharolobus islandicus]|uniref:Flagellar hook-basal body protein,FlgEFG n=1 Tax=Saccharolobus islandicus LAL14/1 TaxID=1241935 RepID=M9UFI3_SACIS|nr:archaellin/type IV pilin N-terminal domain-containing protein [Sulfolobus islandicus]AGJ63376.1 flagellar hook-basal body protein,FlgEFG [Sulfolobus islandicus LAL14/1]
MKKGISSILGAIIIIQIVVLSAGLILYLTSLNAKMSSIAYSQIHKELQNTPISVVPTYQGPMIFSSSASHLTITYIIYPNGQVVHTNIPITQNGVYINFAGYPWSIVVLNDGNWYNISANDRLIDPNITALGEIRIYEPYSYTINQGKINLSYLITPPLYGKNLDPANWNLLSESPASYTPYGIQNSIIFTPENSSIPIVVNLTSGFQYFDIAIPYANQVFVGVLQGATPGIYYTKNSPQFSYYLPLEFGISYQVDYLVPVYNATFKYSTWVDGATYYVTLSYVTYNMIYFMKENNYIIKSYQGEIQLLDYKFLGYLIASKIDYGSAEFGLWSPLIGTSISDIPIPGYNNYTLYSGVMINASYTVFNESGVIPPSASIIPLQGGNEYLNSSNITEESLVSVEMMISGGNLDYNSSGTPIPNVMNYTYFWYFFNPQINPNNVNLIISITPNSQISVALRDYGEFIYPNFGYVAYSLAEKYSVTHNYVGLNGGPPLTVVKDYVAGTLINSSNEGYLPLGYPVISANYEYMVIPQNYNQYTETAIYQYFKAINSQIEYDLPFIIMIPENVYYP